MPTDPAAPFLCRVLPEWIDYNGHMNVAYYVLAFDKATDRLLDRLGVGGAYRSATGHSIYMLEAHVTYEREVKEGDALSIETQLIDADARRLHFFHRMHHAEQGYLAATNELLALHVDLSGPRAVPFPVEAAAAIGTMLAEHRRLPRPPQLGRSIGLRNKRAQ
ncbi:MAG: thioesterase family protein [Acidobacteriota bacterium]